MPGSKPGALPLGDAPSVGNCCLVPAGYGLLLGGRVLSASLRRLSTPCRCRAGRVDSRVAAPRSPHDAVAASGFRLEIRTRSRASVLQTNAFRRPRLSAETVPDGMKSTGRDLCYFHHQRGDGPHQQTTMEKLPPAWPPRLALQSWKSRCGVRGRTIRRKWATDLTVVAHLMASRPHAAKRAETPRRLASPRQSCCAACRWGRCPPRSRRLRP